MNYQGIGMAMGLVYEWWGVPEFSGPVWMPQPVPPITTTVIPLGNEFPATPAVTPEKPKKAAKPHPNFRRFLSRLCLSPAVRRATC